MHILVWRTCLPGGGLFNKKGMVKLVFHHITDDDDCVGCFGVFCRDAGGVIKRHKNYRRDSVCYADVLYPDAVSGLAEYLQYQNPKT